MKRDIALAFGHGALLQVLSSDSNRLSSDGIQSPEGILHYWDTDLFFILSRQTQLPPHDQSVHDLGQSPSEAHGLPSFFMPYHINAFNFRARLEISPKSEGSSIHPFFLA